VGGGGGGGGVGGVVGWFFFFEVLVGCVWFRGGWVGGVLGGWFGVFGGGRVFWFCGGLWVCEWGRGGGGGGGGFLWWGGGFCVPCTPLEILKGAIAGSVDHQKNADQRHHCHIKKKKKVEANTEKTREN